MRFRAIIALLSAVWLSSPGLRSAAAVPNLTGRWLTSEIIPLFPDTCPTDVLQVGTTISFDAFCPLFGVDFRASGTIDSATGAFTAVGTCGFAEANTPGFSMTGASADGLAMSGTLLCPPPLVGGPLAFTGVRQVACGNGIREPGEACDPGIDPCCDGGCQLRTAGGCTTTVGGCIAGACDAIGACVPAGPSAAGTACEIDGDRCTVDVCDGAGTCVVTGPLACAPCARCAGGACVADAWPIGLATRQCQPPQGAVGRSILRVRQERRKLTWTLAEGPIRAAAVVGDPTAGVSYELCLFGEPSPGVYALVGSGVAPAGARWTAGRNRYRFTDRSAVLGTAKLRLVKHTSSDTFIPERLDAQATLKSAGPITTDDFASIGLTPTSRLRAQLRSSAGACWEVPFYALEFPRPGRLESRY